MLFKFDYAAPEDMNVYQIITPGEGFFKILGIRESISKSSGKPMLVLSLMLKNMLGEKTLSTTYLVTDKPQRFYELCLALGKEQEYIKSQGSFNTDILIGATGKCWIETKNNMGTEFKADSRVKYFIARTQKTHEESVLETARPETTRYVEPPPFGTPYNNYAPEETAEKDEGDGFPF